MQKEFSYNGINFTLPMTKVDKAFKNCAKDLENKLPSLEKLHFSVKKEGDRNRAYAIDLRAVSKDVDIISTIQTRNLFKGLKIIKNATLQRLREVGKKKRDQRRRKNKEKQLEFLMENYNFQEAL